MIDESPDNDGELRRRAAWLLGMLVLVAVLIVIVMSFLLRGGGSSDSGEPLGSDPITNTAPPPVGSSSSDGQSQSASSASTSSSTASTRSSTASASAGATLPTGATTCDSSSPCTLPGDTGKALPAINAYRADQGKTPIEGMLTDAARRCALRQGDGCPSGYAVTQVPSADGKLAVQKISQFADFTAPGLKTIQLGWAYDPGAKTYYFATIQPK